MTLSPTYITILATCKNRYFTHPSVRDSVAQANLDASKVTLEDSDHIAEAGKMVEANAPRPSRLLARLMPCVVAALFLSGCDDEPRVYGDEQYRPDAVYDMAADEYVVVDHYDGGSAVPDDAHRCLSMNVYAEARGESIKEQIAVAHVTLNRVQSSRYPDDVCGVVFQPYQFSWTHDPRALNRNVNWKAWQVAEEVARRVLDGRASDPTNGAMFYYAHGKIKPPKWASAAYDIVKLEGHTYMKLRGES